jgi:hypothetical protein
VTNPDTQLLAEHLRAAYEEVLLEQIRVSDPGHALDDARAAAWYRVAERAKELRA